MGGLDVLLKVSYLIFVWQGQGSNERKSLCEGHRTKTRGSV